MDRVNFPAKFIRESLQKKIHQQRNIGRAIAKRWKLNGENIEAIEEIGSKAAGRHAFFEFAVGRCNDSHVYLNRLVTSYGLKLPLLQYPQEFNLSLQRQLADLVEK